MVFGQRYQRFICRMFMAKRTEFAAEVTIPSARCNGLTRDAERQELQTGIALRLFRLGNVWAPQGVRV